MYKNYEVVVDTTQKSKHNSIVVNTNDLKTFKLSITINQSKKPIDLTGATVRLAIVKPDKTTVFQDCSIVDAANGKCEIILNSQAYLLNGVHVSEVMVYFDSETVAVTGRFSYSVMKGLLDGNTLESQNDWQAINKAITDAEGILIDLRENGTGVDAQARADLETVNAELAQKASQEDLVSKRDKSVSIGLNDLSAETITAIEGGAGTTFNLQSVPRDNSVSPWKTNFIITPDNLFNPRNALIGYEIKLPDHTIIENVNTAISGYFEVEEGSNYTGKNIIVWYFYDETQTYVSAITQSTQPQTVTIPTGISFARVLLLKANITSCQVNKGNLLLSYDEHVNKLEDTDEIPLVIKPSSRSVYKETIVEDAVTPEHEAHFKQSPNLFNEKTVLMDKNMDFTGNVVDSLGRVLSDFIPVKPNAAYSKTAFPTLELSLFDKNKNFIKRNPNVASGTTNFTIPEGTYYIRVSPTYSSSQGLMINEGNTLLPHEPYGFTLVSTAEYPISIDEAIVPAGTGGGTGVKNFDIPFLHESVTTLATMAEETVCNISENCYVQSLELSSNTALAEVIIQIRQVDGTLYDYQLMKNDGSGYVPITVQNLVDHGTSEFLFADYDTGLNIYKVVLKDKQYAKGLVVKIKNNDAVSKNLTCRVEGGTYA